ncbi:MAG: YjbH domain-containing protein [Gammaproteobacteria bacterium]|nr:YjbH domain-containing protein [Gammaproteobacteria bacterium]
MRLIRCVRVLLVGLAVIPGSELSAQDLAFPGYSGFLNVPSASVLGHGQAEVGYSDQGFIAGEYGHYHNFHAAVGVFPNLEIGGRIIWNDTHANLFTDCCGPRDLSANVKVQVPFIPENWFSLAAGAQDMGGAANYFDSYYVVAGRQFGPVELALGYGRPDDVPRYLDGGFAALSYRPTRWLNLMLEHDAVDARAGVGLTTPRGWLPGGVQLKGKALAYDRGDSENGRKFFSVGISIPLGGASAGSLKSIAAEATNVFEKPESKEIAAEAAPAVAVVVGQILVGAGYERVSVGSVGNELTVRFENNLFNRDERAALQDVAQRLHQASLGHTSVRLVLLNQNIPVITRMLWLDGDAPRLISASEQALPQQWDYQGSDGPVWRPRLTLSPRLSTGVATEYGVLDTSLALTSEVSSSLWSGALASVSWNAELYSSDDFDESGPFAAARQRTDLLHADLQQAFRPHRQLFTAFYGGRYLYDYNGWLNETLLFTPGRRHALGFLTGNFWNADNSDDQSRQMLGRYSWYWAERDVLVNVHAGEFFEGDSGFRVDNRFWFGDCAITLTYKNTEAEFIGMGVVIPLTPTKDRQFRYLQVRGNPDWNYTLQTRINEDTNVVSFGTATMVRSPNSLDRLYLNRLRLAP